MDISKEQLKSKYWKNCFLPILFVVQISAVLQQIFDSFDVDKKGNIGVDMIGQILDMLGHQLTADELQVGPQRAHYRMLDN